MWGLSCVLKCSPLSFDLCPPRKAKNASQTKVQMFRTASIRRLRLGLTPTATAAAAQMSSAKTRAPTTGGGVRHNKNSTSQGRSEHDSASTSRDTSSVGDHADASAFSWGSVANRTVSFASNPFGLLSSSTSSSTTRTSTTTTTVVTNNVAIGADDIPTALATKINEAEAISAAALGGAANRNGFGPSVASHPVCRNESENPNSTASPTASNSVSPSESHHSTIASTTMSYVSTISSYFSTTSVTTAQQLPPCTVGAANASDPLRETPFSTPPNALATTHSGGDPTTSNPTPTPTSWVVSSVSNSVVSGFFSSNESSESTKSASLGPATGSTSCVNPLIGSWSPFPIIHKASGFASMASDAAGKITEFVGLIRAVILFAVGCIMIMLVARTLREVLETIAAAKKALT